LQSCALGSNIYKKGYIGLRNWAINNCIAFTQGGAIYLNSNKVTLDLIGKTCIKEYLSD